MHVRNLECPLYTLSGSKNYLYFGCFTATSQLTVYDAYLRNETTVPKNGAIETQI